MYFSIIALLQAGDEAIYPNPGFPIYESMIKFQGATPVPVPLSEERWILFRSGCAPQPIDQPQRLVVLELAREPTGGIMPAEDVKKICWR